MRLSGPLRLSGYCGGRCWRLVGVAEGHGSPRGREASGGGRKGGGTPKTPKTPKTSKTVRIPSGTAKTPRRGARPTGTSGSANYGRDRPASGRAGQEMRTSRTGRQPGTGRGDAGHEGVTGEGSRRAPSTDRPRRTNRTSSPDRARELPTARGGEGTRRTARPQASDGPRRTARPSRTEGPRRTTTEGPRGEQRVRRRHGPRPKAPAGPRPKARAGRQPGRSAQELAPPPDEAPFGASAEMVRGARVRLQRRPAPVSSEERGCDPARAGSAGSAGSAARAGSAGRAARAASGALLPAPGAPPGTGLRRARRARATVTRPPNVREPSRTRSPLSNSIPRRGLS